MLLPVSSSKDLSVKGYAPNMFEIWLIWERERREYSDQQGKSLKSILGRKAWGEITDLYRPVRSDGRAAPCHPLQYALSLYLLSFPNLSFMWTFDLCCPTLSFLFFFSIFLYSSFISVPFSFLFIFSVCFIRLYMLSLQIFSFLLSPIFPKSFLYVDLWSMLSYTFFLLFFYLYLFFL